MKKLVCLMIVALLGTVASAGTMWFCGADTIGVDSTMEISIMSDVSGVFGVNIGAIALDKGTAAVGTINSSLTGTLNNPGEQKNGETNGIFIFQVGGTAAQGVTVDASTALYTFTIDSTGLAVGDVITISEWKGSNPFGMPPFPIVSSVNAVDTAIAPLAITVVPEPMTIALLGLGGLFIRRRK